MTIDNLVNQESITRQYERTRLENISLWQQRQEEIYHKYPRIQAIDDELTNARINVIRQRVKKASNASDLNKQLQSEATRLNAEKLQILQQGGYPADYLERIYTCRICEDTGYVDGMRCECFNKKLIENLYIQSNLKNILDIENFSTFKMDYYSREPVSEETLSPYENVSVILDMLHRYIDSFEDNFTQQPNPTGNDIIVKPNILFWGNTGLGKTFLTNCIAKELLDRGHSVLYLSANDLFENLIGSYIMQGKTELEDLYKLVYNCELLVIDDLGTEYTNNFVRSQLFEIINKRALERKSTLISTNLDLTALENNYTPRTVSRLLENYNIFNLYGDNIRYQKLRNSIQ